MFKPLPCLRLFQRYSYGSANTQSCRQDWINSSDVAGSGFCFSFFIFSITEMRCIVCKPKADKRSAHAQAAFWYTSWDPIHNFWLKITHFAFETLYNFQVFKSSKVAFNGNFRAWKQFGIFFKANIITTMKICKSETIFFNFVNLSKCEQAPLNNALHSTVWRHNET